jgi:hypothetical protein
MKTDVFLDPFPEIRFIPALKFGHAFVRRGGLEETYGEN